MGFSVIIIAINIIKKNPISSFCSWKVRFH